MYWVRAHYIRLKWKPRPCNWTFGTNSTLDGYLGTQWRYFVNKIFSSTSLGLRKTAWEFGPNRSLPPVTGHFPCECFQIFFMKSFLWSSTRDQEQKTACCYVKNCPFGIKTDFRAYVLSASLFNKTKMKATAMQLNFLNQFRFRWVPWHPMKIFCQQKFFLNQFRPS